MQNINGIDNKLVAGIDIGSENIYCAIGSLIPENSRIKFLGIGKCSVKESFPTLYFEKPFLSPRIL